MYRSRFEIRSVVVGLIIANAVIFVAQNIGAVRILFSLSPAMVVEKGWVWQVFTYMFLHGSPLHLFFNMYALLLFGRPLEERWGGKRFLAFYLVTGTGAGIVTFLWNLGLWRSMGVPTATVGASGAIFGVMLAFGLEFPDVLLLLFFLVPVRAKYATLLYGALELVFLLTGRMAGVSHVAHLSGLLFGYIYYILALRAGPGRRWTRSRAFPGVRRGGTFPEGSRGARGRFGPAGDGERRKEEARKEREVELTRALREKVRAGEPLTRNETVFLLKLKEAFDGTRGGICEPGEFDADASSCLRCEDFRACLYRYVVGMS